MKKLEITTSLETYSSADELNEEDRSLLEKAKEALRNAYAPYSKFQVGAAALLNNGQIVQGSNQENAAFPMCICAEQVTLSTVSASHPDSAIVSLAITVRSELKVISNPATPCGACRQVILEKEVRQKAPIRLIMAGEKGEVYIAKSIRDIFPLGFSSEFL